MLSIFGIQTFRPKQLEVINATLSNKDVIVIMPTGGGKSLCYQLTAIISKGELQNIKMNTFFYCRYSSQYLLTFLCLGVTLVVTPLISLIENQLFNLRKHNIEAGSLNGNSTKVSTLLACSVISFIYLN